MFGIVHYEAFVLTAIMLNLIPGTDTMYIISRSISQGRQAGILSVLGILTGSLIHTVLAAFGLSLILAQSVVLFNIVKILGVAYLVYLGVRMFMTKEALSFDSTASPGRKAGKVYGQAIVTSVTNPKVALFFIAFLPQFVDATHTGPLPFLLLGLTFTLTGGIWFSLVALFASFVTQKLRNNPHFSSILNKLTGIVFIGMGLNLLRAKATP
ncbi:LysE family translocator [Brevibacillus agri]|uniref:LysE family translocator n=1 Tax=Brevibacillus TaxID=55080 RepID=UPI0002A4F306|nr:MULTISPECIES: LysE family translocator [Brevibacillus]ELK41753.1 amino acid efflux protein [Brevibacillus agri BAB-2500]MBG9567716.1 homoserine lactone transporter [Brevibacillus agri]MBY0052138.1 LysE family translocator [Brevibacillus agri]MCG5251076.1 LysE family translocator [Brevibacillus agri]MDN4093535.1 LysE family translocator [Brevibacillus agri]